MHLWWPSFRDSVRPLLCGQTCACACRLLTLANGRAGPTSHAPGQPAGSQSEKAFWVSDNQRTQTVGDPRVKLNIRPKPAAFRILKPENLWAKIKLQNRNPQIRNPRISDPTRTHCHPERPSSAGGGPPQTTRTHATSSTRSIHGEAFDGLESGKWKWFDLDDGWP